MVAMASDWLKNWKSLKFFDSEPVEGMKPNEASS
jgi:hypothetical protein